MVVQGEEPQFLKHIISNNLIKETEINKGLVFKYKTPDNKIKQDIIFQIFI